MNQLVQTEQKKPREISEVIDPVPMLDTARFEHMQRVATVMARSTLMPETLYKEGPKDNKTPLPYEQILSNCFLVVNQAVRWGLDPFAVAQCVSVVHGKLCYEGKLVSAVLQAKLSINLHHTFVGSGDEMRIYLSDQPFTEEVIELLKPGYRRNDMRIFDGSVNEWKTTGNGTPWTPKNFPRMLIYRGTRDWCRIYEPALMLGVYTPDEMEDLEDTSRYQRARDVTPKPSIMERLSQPREDQGAQEGFDGDNVTRETSMLSGDNTEQNTSVDSPQDTGVPGEVEPSSLSQSNPADDESAIEPDEELDTSADTSSGSTIPGMTRMLMEECVEGMLRSALSKPDSAAMKEIEKLVEVFKGEEPLAEHFQFIELCAETCRRIVGKPAEQARAKAYLLTKVPAVETTEVE